MKEEEQAAEEGETSKKKQKEPLGKLNSFSSPHTLLPFFLSFLSPFSLYLLLLFLSSLEYTTSYGLTLDLRLVVPKVRDRIAPELSAITTAVQEKWYIYICLCI